MQNRLRILITGASRGMGKAIAQRLCLRAEKMLLTSKQSGTLDKAITEINTLFKGEVSCFNVDQAMAKEESKRLCGWVREQTDYLDAVILCAGDFVEGKIQEVSIDDFEKNMNVNFNFNYYIINELIPLLKKVKSSKIIIIGSTAAYNSYSVPTYSITKWALRGYVANLREELRPEGIGVTFISPGPTLTDMWADVEFPPDRLLMPDDISKVVDSLFELSPQAVIEELVVRPILGDVDE